MTAETRDSTRALAIAILAVLVLSSVLAFTAAAHNVSAPSPAGTAPAPAPTAPSASISSTPASPASTVGREGVVEASATNPASLTPAADVAALGSLSASPRQLDVAVPGSAPSVGDGNDWYADTPSGTSIGVVTGTFPAEAGVTGEVSANGPGGGPICALGASNCYGLQINTNQWSLTYDGTATTGSEQFVYQDNGTSYVMAIWVILYGFTTCPSAAPSGYSSWDLDLGNCYAHSPFVSVPTVPVTDLSAVTMTAYANQSGNDALVFCVNPAISGWPVCTATSASDAINLSYGWTVAEFNVFGDNGGSQAAFNAGAALQVQTQIATEGGGALVPSCASAPGVHTVEDNNLYLWPCSASSAGILFWEANESFGLSATPANATVQAGQPAAYSVGFTSFAGFPAPVQLTVVSPLPSGVSQSFPVTVTPPTSGALTLTTSPTTPLGDYTFTVQGQIASLTGGPIATTTVSLHIFNFTVSISPGSQTVLRGLTADYAVQLSLDSGSTLVGVPPIVLSDPGLPGDSSLSGFNPSGYVLSSFVPTTVPFAVQTAPAPSGSLGDFPFGVTGTAQGYADGVANASATLRIYDYTVAVIPSGQTVLRGGNPATYYLDLTLVPGSSTFGIPGEVISVSGLPSGTPLPTLSSPTIVPSLAGCSPPLCPTLTVTTQGPPSGPLGDSSFTVTTTDPVNGGSRSGSAGLHIFDFAATLTPSESLFQGESVTMKVSLPLDPGSTTVGLPSVSLSLTGLPSGVIAVGFPSSLVAGGSQTFKLETSSVGSYISCPQVSNNHGGQNLRDANLAHCDLAGYDLKGDNLANANLVDANLSDANLAGANLQYANLSGSNTSGTDFFAANMQGADVSAPGDLGTFILTVTATVDGSSRLGFSTLTVYGDQLSGDNVQFANLQGADLAGDLAVGTSFQGDNLALVDLAGADLDGASLDFANLQFADLAGVQAVGANLQSDNLWGVDLAGADLDRATLQSSNLQSANLAGDLAVGANFAGDNLGSADFAGADLQGANLQFDNLQRADLAGAVLTGLGPASSQETDFNWANLQSANLTGAVCGTPNYITAFGANTHGVIGVPSTCNPPLGPSPAAMSLVSLAMLPFELPIVTDWLVLTILIALGAILGVTRAARGRRPPSNSTGCARVATGPATPSGPAGELSDPARAVRPRLREFGTTYASQLRLERESYQTLTGGRSPPGVLYARADSTVARGESTLNVEGPRVQRPQPHSPRS